MKVFVAIEKKTCHTINFVVEEGVIVTCNEPDFIGKKMSEVKLKNYNIEEIK